MPLESRIYYGAKLLHTVIHPRSVKDPKEAKEDVREKITIVVKEKE